MSKKALIAMSGGVDSSVAAFLMQKEGYECIGATMKLYEKDAVCPDAKKLCGSSDDIEDAKAIAERLGFPHYVFHFEDRFREKVIDRFVESYLNGKTPNPCVDCNRHLKFDGLYQKGIELGCDVVVTGHYVRILEDDKGYHLAKAIDESKDQSYVLYSLTKEQLAHTVFPLGTYSKPEIRQIAEENGFVNAKKQDSQDICFIPDGDYKAFIERTTGKRMPAGEFVDQKGNFIGKNKGYYSYTIGQRKGLGIASEAPFYVVDIIPEENKVVLGRHEELFREELLAENFNWLEEYSDEMQLKARIRYHQKEIGATVQIQEDNRVKIKFCEPQRAITRGQAVVLYEGDRVIGGGTICG